MSKSAAPTSPLGVTPPPAAPAAAATAAPTQTEIPKAKAKPAPAPVGAQPPPPAEDGKPEGEAAPRFPADLTETTDGHEYEATHALSRAVQRSGPPNLATPAQTAPSAPPPAEPEVEAAAPLQSYVEHRYEVLEDAEIPTKCSRFAIHKGQIVTSALFDIGVLKTGGAKLRELKPLEIKPEAAAAAK
jgi:hypothetical protein